MGACQSTSDDGRKTFALPKIELSATHNGNHHTTGSPAGSMGSVTESENEQTTNERINRTLKFERKIDRHIFKVLLLGTGECGKSTILKQMKLMYKGGFTEQERENFADIIRQNTLQSMQQLTKACFDLEIEFGTPELVEIANRMQDLTNQIVLQSLANPDVTIAQQFAAQIISDIQTLRTATAIETAFTQTSRFYLLDSASYFIPRAEVIFALDYQPTDADILHSRLPTTGVIETELVIGERTYHFFDVGGQIGERKKWIHCFEHVDAILFIGSLNEWDQTLSEDTNKNRFYDSLDLFEGLLTLPWFKDTNILLFLNKSDLFAEKIQRLELSDYFDDYDPEENTNFAHGVEFLKEKYLARNHDPTRTVYVQHTDATDTVMVKFVWDSAQDIIVHRNLQTAGLIE